MMAQLSNLNPTVVDTEQILLRIAKTPLSPDYRDPDVHGWPASNQNKPYHHHQFSRPGLRWVERQDYYAKG